MSRGEAGRRSAEVRSDLYLSFERRGAGGVEIALDSKVEPYYGEAIRRQVCAELAALGIEHAHLDIEDRGALPFVISARLRTALARAGESLGPPAARSPATPPSARDRLRRSRLYLPGNEPKFMVNAGLFGADAVILDLEDSVHHGEKDAARQLVSTALATLDFGAAERMVRINQMPLGSADLEAVIPAAPDLILVPKVEEAGQVRAVDEQISALQSALGLEREVWLMPILESALGIEEAFSIARASQRIVALTIGLEDYTADLGVVKTPAGEETLWARSRLLNAARAAGCQAIDSVYGDVADEEGLRAWAIRSRALGFEGMGCVHPRQIAVIHQAFAPSPAEIERALRIAKAFEEAGQRGLGVVSLGSKMIDPPVVSRALKLVNQARAMGLLERREEGDG